MRLPQCLASEATARAQAEEIARLRRVEEASIELVTIIDAYDVANIGSISRLRMALHKAEQALRAALKKE